MNPSFCSQSRFAVGLAPVGDPLTCGVDRNTIELPSGELPTCATGFSTSAQRMVLAWEHALDAAVVDVGDVGMFGYPYPPKPPIPPLPSEQAPATLRSIPRCYQCASTRDVTDVLGMPLCASCHARGAVAR